ALSSWTSILGACKRFCVSSSLRVRRVMRKSSEHSRIRSPQLRTTLCSLTMRFATVSLSICSANLWARTPFFLHLEKCTERYNTGSDMNQSAFRDPCRPTTDDGERTADLLRVTAWTEAPSFMSCVKAACFLGKQSMTPLRAFL